MRTQFKELHFGDRFFRHFTMLGEEDNGGNKRNPLRNDRARFPPSVSGAINR